MRISNEYGNKPLQIHGATIAYHEHAGKLVDKSVFQLKYSGDPQFTIPVGQSIVSDAVEIPVKALQELAVSLYFAHGTGVSTTHTTAIQTAYITDRENQTALVSPRVDNKDDSRYFVTDIEVLAEDGAQTLVVLGDSTSDGVGSGLDDNTRWPDHLASRLQSSQKTRHIAVVNSGISGNRILNDGLEPFLGPSTLNRFQRDVLSKQQVKWIILLQGVNDIAGTAFFSDDKQKVSAMQIIDGMKALIAKAHRHKIKIFGATILPRAGATGQLGSTQMGEEMRQQLNNWIRNSKAFDGVIDFDQAIRDPHQPDRQLPVLNSGDFRHPNAAGYRVMAEAIDLNLFQ